MIATEIIHVDGGVGVLIAIVSNQLPCLTTMHCIKGGCVILGGEGNSFCVNLSRLKGLGMKRNLHVYTCMHPVFR